MPKPLDETKRAAILADIRAGQKPRNQIARDHDVSPSTVTGVAKTAGITDAFDRSQTLKATRAKSDDNAAKRAQLYPLFCLYAYLAFRRAEGCGLKWTETDLDNSKLLVGETTIVQLGSEVIVQDEAKTEESQDWVTVPPEVIVPLRACRAQQAAERLRWGPQWNDTGFCFTWENEDPYDPEQVSGAFERTAFEAGLPPVSLRDIRHCAPTLALAGGEDIKVVSAMMRHTSVKVTADV
jgi:integrase